MSEFQFTILRSLSAAVLAAGLLVNPMLASAADKASKKTEAWKKTNEEIIKLKLQLELGHWGESVKFPLRQSSLPYSIEHLTKPKFDVDFADQAKALIIWEVTEFKKVGEKRETWKSPDRHNKKARGHVFHLNVTKGQNLKLGKCSRSCVGSGCGYSGPHSTYKSGPKFDPDGSHVSFYIDHWGKISSHTFSCEVIKKIARDQEEVLNQVDLIPGNKFEIETPIVFSGPGKFKEMYIHGTFKELYFKMMIGYSGKYSPLEYVTAFPRNNKIVYQYKVRN